MQMLLQKGKRYQADIKLSGVKAIAPNSEVVRKFVELGFVNVQSSGTGSKRTASGMWAGTSLKIDLPSEVENVKEI